MDFVTRKITSAAAKIKLGLDNEGHLGNLDTLRDWGFAGDYVNGMWRMLQQPYPDDFVLSTGVVYSIRDFCECAFGCLGLDYRAYVKTDPNNFRPSEPVALVGNSEKARLALNWQPSVHFHELVNMMVISDLKMFDTKSLS
jgi:GDPmannose 4,6-dehydratase